MLGPGGGGGRMIRRLVQAFREKGATSPDKAMTVQELGLPPRFEEAMKARLGANGIFVDVGGRYYLDEAKLKQVREERMAGGWGARGAMLTIRIVRMAVGVAAVLLALINILIVRSLDLSLVVVVLLVLWLVLTVYQIFRFSRMRRRWTTQGPASPELTAHFSLTNSTRPSLNLMLAWLPLQKGLFADAPQRHRATLFLVS